MDVASGEAGGGESLIGGCGGEGWVGGVHLSEVHVVFRLIGNAVEVEGAQLAERGEREIGVFADDWVGEGRGDEAACESGGALLERDGRPGALRDAGIAERDAGCRSRPCVAERADRVEVIDGGIDFPWRRIDRIGVGVEESEAVVIWIRKAGVGASGEGCHFVSADVIAVDDGVGARNGAQGDGCDGESEGSGGFHGGNC